HPPHPAANQHHQPGVEAPDQPQGAPDAGRATRRDALPDATMDGHGVALNPVVALAHSVPPPTSPSRPMSTVPPPKRPAFVKKPMLPDRIWAKGLSKSWPKSPTNPTSPMMTPNPTTQVWKVLKKLWRGMPKAPASLARALSIRRPITTSPMTRFTLSL